MNIACVNREELLNQVDEWAGQPGKKTILYANAHCLNLASQDKVYRDILNRADLVYADGISLVWGSRFLGGCRLEKNTGADWIEDYCVLAQAQARRIFIVAGKPGIAQIAAEKLKVRYPQLCIVGTCDGYFADQENAEAAMIEEINQAQPQMVFIGMGAPRQEKWLAVQRARIDAPVCWAVGALFDYVAGAELRVPKWLESLGMEWFWRLMINPKGKWRRYLIGNPMFFYRVLQQKLARN